MFILMKSTTRAGVDSLTVTLDISPVDVVVDNDTTKKMVAEAKKANRKFCAIYREHTGTTLFTYAPANQAHIEVQLLAMLSAPHTEVTVNTETGGIESWVNS